jgi:hypothetical protein
VSASATEKNLDQSGRRSKNFPEVIQRIRKSKVNIPAMITSATMIIFVSFGIEVMLAMCPDVLWFWTPFERLV